MSWWTMLKSQQWVRHCSYLQTWRPCVPWLCSVPHVAAFNMFNIPSMAAFHIPSTVAHAIIPYELSGQLRCLLWHLELALRQRWYSHWSQSSIPPSSIWLESWLWGGSYLNSHIRIDTRVFFLTIKMQFYQYRDSHIKDKTVTTILSL